MSALRSGGATDDATNDAPGRLPIAGLLVLATGCFVTILTEALPAGLLPQMAETFGVSESLAGQAITLYAVGSMLAAIPITMATRNWRRRPLLLIAIAGFLIANAVTASVDSFMVMMAARLVAEMSAGLLWALVAGYAIRIAPSHLGGRAMAIAMAGTPIALSVGIPAGAWLGLQTVWQIPFFAMSAIAAILLVLVPWLLPDFAGERKDEQEHFGQIVMRPGIPATLGVVLLFVLAHNVLYTYIAPLLASKSARFSVDAYLLVFGIAALASIAMVGVWIDRHLRLLSLVSIALFALAAALFWPDTASNLPAYAAAAIWGLGFGGTATLFQTASARAAGPAADLAQARLVTVWIAAIAGGAMLGGYLLDAIGPESFSPILLAVLLAAFLLIATSRGFGKAI